MPASQAGRRRFEPGRPTHPFRYVDKGELATIGKHRAVASFLGGRIRVAGWIAWWFWLALHLVYLVGFRSRLSVLLQWSYSYLFAGRGARLLLGGDSPVAEVAVPAVEAEAAHQRTPA